MVKSFAISQPLATRAQSDEESQGSCKGFRKTTGCFRFNIPWQQPQRAGNGDLLQHTAKGVGLNGPGLKLSSIAVFNSKPSVHLGLERLYPSRFPKN